MGSNMVKPEEIARVSSLLLWQVRTQRDFVQQLEDQVKQAKATLKSMERLYEAHLLRYPPPATEENTL